MKKIIAGLLAVLMLTGCAQKTNETQKVTVNKTGYPITEEKITLRVMGAKQSIQTPWDTMAFFQKMEEMTNIHLEFDTPPGSNYEEKKNLMLASGDVPDFFFAGYLTNSDELTYGKQGLLIPLNSLIDEYAPNIQKMFEEQPDTKKSITTPNGNIYALPGVSGDTGTIIKLWFNKKWMDKLGNPAVPTNTDELYRLLKRFAEEDANGNGVRDEIPLSSIGMFGIKEVFLSYFGGLSADVEVKDGKVVFGAITEPYKEYLAFCHKLYEEKLMDEETFSQTSDQWTAKGKENRVGLSFQAAPYLYYDVASDEENLEYPVLPPLTSPVNSELMYPIMGYGTTRGTFAISNKNPYPEATVRWVDFLYSPEGYTMVTMNDEYKWLDEEKTQWVYNPPAGTEDSEKYRASTTPAVGNSIPVRIDTAFQRKQKDVINQSLSKMDEEVFKPYAANAIPQFYFTDEEQSKISDIATDINLYVTQMEAKFITGVEPLSNWDSYVENVKKMGLDELLAQNQTAYERYMQVN